MCIILFLSGSILLTCFIGELAAAVRKKTDIKFGVYHSLFEWYNPLYMEDEEHNYTTNEFVRVSQSST